MPSIYMLIKLQEMSASPVPFVQKILISEVKQITNSNGFKLFNMVFGEMRDMTINDVVIHSINKNATSVVDTNTDAR